MERKEFIGSLANDRVNTQSSKLKTFKNGGSSLRFLVRYLYSFLACEDSPLLVVCVRHVHSFLLIVTLYLPFFTLQSVVTPCLPIITLQFLRNILDRHVRQYFYWRDLCFELGQEPCRCDLQRHQHCWVSKHPNNIYTLC